MPIEESLTKNKVENPTAAIGKASKKTLMCENEYSPGNTFWKQDNVKHESYRQRKCPMRDSFNCKRNKKIATEKALIAASRKEVFE